MNYLLLIGNVLGISGLIAAVYYLVVTRAKVEIPSHYNPTIIGRFIRIKRRRRFEAVLMAIISVQFLIAINFFSAAKSMEIILFWLLLLILLLWLIVLALLDMLDVSRLRRQINAQTGQKFMGILENPQKDNGDDYHKK